MYNYDLHNSVAFAVSVSDNGNDFVSRDVTMSELAVLLGEGYTITGAYKNTPFTVKDKTVKNVKQTNIVCISIKNSEHSMEEWLEEHVLNIQPQMAYTSNNDGFNLLYFFDKPITSPSEFTKIYEIICAANNIADASNDTEMRLCNQAFIGNATGKCRVVYLNDDDLFSKGKLIKHATMFIKFQERQNKSADAFQFDLCATTTPSTTKILKKDYWKLNFQQQTVTVEDLAQEIVEGRIFTGVYKDATFPCKDKRIENFMRSNVIAIDIDNSDCEMEDYMDVLAITPTIAFTTYSNGADGKGYRFRFIYVFDEPITSPSEFTQLYEMMCAANNIVEAYNDTAMRLCNQCFIGNGSGQCRIITNPDMIISLSSFKSQYKHLQVTKSANNYNNKENTPHTLKQSIALSFNDSEFEHFWLNGSDNEVLKQMRHYHSESSTPIEFNDGELWHDLEDTPYYIIKHKWQLQTVHSNGEDKKVPVTVKVKDGEGRRKRIFLALIRRRLINPSLTLEHLCYAALSELVYYTENNQKDFITRQQLAYIANNALNTDLTRYADQLRDNKKFIMNKEEVNNQGMSMAKAVGKANGQRNRIKKEQRYAVIREYYDHTKTDKENLQILNDNGINISLRTLKNFRKDSGLNKYKTKVQITTIIKKNTTDTLKQSIALSDERSVRTDTIDDIVKHLGDYYSDGADITEYQPQHFLVNLSNVIIWSELTNSVCNYLYSQNLNIRNLCIDTDDDRYSIKTFKIYDNI